MRLDKFSNPVFNDRDIFDALYKGYSLTSEIIAELTPDIKSLEAVSSISFTEPYPEDLEVSVEEYDAVCQDNWFMPEEYKTLDIETWTLEQCGTEEEFNRVQDELDAFKQRNMINLLRWLKYFVDTCTQHDIVWGVGRGSSVASYVLYKIGVHRIDSIKYNLDWQEFLR
jgi:DNA polymerase III alpha subunit